MPHWFDVNTFYIFKLNNLDTKGSKTNNLPY